LKILFLANRVPYPPYRGDKLKIYNLAKRLQGHHELHLLTFAQNEEDLSYKAELEQVFASVQFIYLPKWRSALNCIAGLWSKLPLQVLYFRSAAMQKALNQLLEKNKYDAIHVQHLRMSPYLAARKDLARILDLPDAFSLYWARRKQVKRSLPVTIFENMEQKRVLNYEGVLKEYDMALACSSEDLAYLEHHHQSGNLRLLPNGVDRTTFSPRNHDYRHHSTLLFTGNMDYAPNVDAVQYFVAEILPEIRNKIPGVQFIIAGQRPVQKVLDLATTDITVTGFIKDLAATYNAASVVVAPLRFGAGTQNKVLEAMAMGVPVVCSNIGFAGLGIKSGEGAIMQTDPMEFANTVIRLLSAEKERKAVGEAGATVIRTRFDWDIIALQLQAYLAEVAEKKK
jgi:polysaccharide biosynthesis protein PslH